MDKKKDVGRQMVKHVKVERTGSDFKAGFLNILIRTRRRRTGEGGG
jgi:hypothetical protein